MIEKTLHDGRARLLYGAPNLETLAQLPDESVQCVVTSPPYFGLRQYGEGEQIGLEETPEQFVAALVEVFREVRRVLRPDGTLWLNLGDSYCGGGGFAPDAPCNQRRAEGEDWGKMNSFSPKEGKARKKARPGYTPPGLKPKDLMGMPWRVALALQADGWWLRQDIIWHKPNPMPSSAKDRCTTAHEYIFLLSKSRKYYFDQLKEPSVTGERFHGGYDAVMGDGSMGHSRNGRHDADNYTPTRNKRSVWTIPTHSYAGSHFAVFPEEIPRLAITAGSQGGDTVLDPFSGSGTTGKVALQLGRNYIGLDVNEDYLELALRRVDQYRADSPMHEEEDGQADLFTGVDHG